MTEHLRERVAYHEAGHAAGCVLFGGRVLSATIKPSADRLAVTRFIPPDSAPWHIRLALAGGIATRIWAGGAHRHWPVGDDDDIATVNAIMKEHYGDAAKRPWAKRMLRELTRHTYDALKQHWRGVRAVADALLKHETLDGLVIRDIFHSTEGT